MRFLRKVAIAAAILLGSSVAAAAQSSPGWTYGFVPTPAQWNNAFAVKQDYLGAPPLLVTGGTMTGKLVTATPNTSVAGINLPAGTAPASPINGDMWTTTSGLFVRINGATVGPLIDATGSAVIVIGTTPVSSGTTTRVLFDNGGVVGEYAISGTGSVAMTTSPTFVTPTLGVASSTSVAAGFCVISTNTLCSNGTSLLSGAVTLSSTLTYGGVTLSAAVTGTGAMVLANTPTLITPVLGVASGTSVALGGCTIGAAKLCANGAITSGQIVVTDTSTSALIVGPNGATNPSFQVDGSTGSAATGIKVTAIAAAGLGPRIEVISSGTNENLRIDAKGSGTITLGSASTGAITLTRATTMSAALTYGGVTLNNAVTGTGNMVLATAPSVSSLTVTTAFTATGLVGLGNLANIGANTVLSNWTSGSAAVTANTWPACAADGLHALTYTNGTGVVCTVLTTGGAGTVTALTPGAGLVSSVTASCSQSNITTTGTLSIAECLNAKTTTSESFADSDRGKFVTFSNAGATAVTIARAGTASAFQNGWVVFARNKGAGTVTITPTTSTIDGSATYTLRQNDWVAIVSDGTDYQVYSARACCGRLTQTYTGSTTYTVPNGVYFVRTKVWGGGGGSGGTDIGTNASAGGGGGEYCETVVAVTPGSGITVTVGAAGTAGSSSGPSNGGNGGQSAFGSITANGGSGSAANSAGAGTGGGAGGSAGTCTGGFQVSGSSGGQNNTVNQGALLQAGAGGSAFGTPTVIANAAGLAPGGGAAGQVTSAQNAFAGGAGRVLVYE